MGLSWIWSAPDWVPLTDRDRSIALLDENGQGLLKLRDSTKIQAGIEELKLTPKDSPPLTIYRFNTPHLCGVAGCLYSIYDRTQNRRLFQVMLGEDNKITVVNNCLKIEQFTDRTTRSIKYCNTAGTYIQSAIEDKPS